MKAQSNGESSLLPRPGHHIGRIVNLHFREVVVICGADGWGHVALFAKTKWGWFKTLLELPAAHSATTPSGASFPR